MAIFFLLLLFRFASWIRSPDVSSLFKEQSLKLNGEWFWHHSRMKLKLYWKDQFSENSFKNFWNLKLNILSFDTITCIFYILMFMLSRRFDSKNGYFSNRANKCFVLLFFRENIVKQCCTLHMSRSYLVKVTFGGKPCSVSLFSNN